MAYHTVWHNNLARIAFLRTGRASINIPACAARATSPALTPVRSGCRVSSGWVAAAAQAPWSKNPQNPEAPAGATSPCPTSGGCGRISRRKPSRGSVLNWARSAAEPQGERRAPRRSPGCGCSGGKRNSWTECFPRRSRTCAAPLRRLLKEKRPNPPRRWALMLRLWGQLLGPQAASPSWRPTGAPNSPCPSWWCTSRRAPLSARRASRSW